MNGLFNVWPIEVVCNRVRRGWAPVRNMVYIVLVGGYVSVYSHCSSLHLVALTTWILVVDSCVWCQLANNPEHENRVNRIIVQNIKQRSAFERQGTNITVDVRIEV